MATLDCLRHRWILNLLVLESLLFSLFKYSTWPFVDFIVVNPSFFKHLLCVQNLFQIDSLAAKLSKWSTGQFVYVWEDSLENHENGLID